MKLYENVNVPVHKYRDLVTGQTWCGATIPDGGRYAEKNAAIGTRYWNSTDCEACLKLKPPKGGQSYYGGGRGND